MQSRGKPSRQTARRKRRKQRQACTERDEWVESKDMSTSLGYHQSLGIFACVVAEHVKRRTHVRLSSRLIGRYLHPVSMMGLSACGMREHGIPGSQKPRIPLEKPKRKRKPKTRGPRPTHIPAPSAPSSILNNGLPTSTVSSSFARSSTILPACVAFTLTSTLSVSIVATSSSTSTLSPTALSHCFSVPSVMDSATLGTTTVWTSDYAPRRGAHTERRPRSVGWYRDRRRV